jgi:hypothetical protein
MSGRGARGERAFLTSEPVGRSVFHDDWRYEVNRLAEPVATQRHTYVHTCAVRQRILLPGHRSSSQHLSGSLRHRSRDDAVMSAAAAAAAAAAATAAAAAAALYTDAADLQTSLGAFDAVESARGRARGTLRKVRYIKSQRFVKGQSERGARGSRREATFACAIPRKIFSSAARIGRRLGIRNPTPYISVRACAV